ncbi:MAG: undecaprenyl-diphosphate phosphatase [Heliobacteriaceae bacterium]|jgi:undecaprenyl-diphosphatase|nr:undecaprenyl-diphosphate phosphatase [Heliobacteriaceae bacterium]
MNLIQAILMGIVQGLSEFLPISSSAHLVFTSNFYKVFKGIEIVHSNEEVFFDIMLHFGTLIAVFIFFRKDITEILKALFKGDFSEPKAKTGLYIILGTVITVAFALPLDGFAEKLVFSPSIVGILLAVTGVVLIWSERNSNKTLTPPLSQGEREVSLKQSVIMAFAQGLAVLPGFSRSGWTIAAGLFSGLDRVTAARYSFLLSIPIILGASMLYPFIKLDLHELNTYNWHAIITGTVVSGLTGYLCIKYFMRFLSKFSLSVFGYYCVIAGLGAAVFFYMV